MEANSTPPTVFCCYGYVKIVAVLAGWLYICWLQNLHFPGILSLNKLGYFVPALTLLISVMPSIKLNKKLHIKAINVPYGKILLEMGQMRVNRRNRVSKRTE